MINETLLVYYIDSKSTLMNLLEVSEDGHIWKSVGISTDVELLEMVINDLSKKYGGKRVPFRFTIYPMEIWNNLQEYYQSQGGC